MKKLMAGLALALLFFFAGIVASISGAIPAVSQRQDLIKDNSFRPFTPEFISFLKENESSVTGDIMRLRAKGLKANLGEKHAEYLLYHQDLIPKKLRKKHTLVFPGTVWRDSAGFRFVPCLMWHHYSWYLLWFCLDFNWHSNALIVGARP